MPNPMQPFEKSIQIDGKSARYYDFASLSDVSSDAAQTDKPIIHFYGGNGFPVGVYEPLIIELAKHFHVISLAMRGYWYDKPTANVLTRDGDAKMLIKFLEHKQLQQTQNTPLIGIGHSQGATATAMAAAQRPDLFSQLILLEPVTFTKTQKILYDLLPKKLKMTQEPFKGTLIKQTTWDSIDDYYQYLRGHRAYKRMSDDNLYTFAKNSLIQSQQNQQGGYELLFSPQQELANYFGTPYITDALKQLNKTGTPYHIVLGKPSVFVSNKVRKSWQGIVANERLTVLPKYGHLLPMEAPKPCADIIVDKFEQLDGDDK